MTRLQKPEELVFREPRLIHDRKKSPARDVLALWDDHEPNAAAAFLHESTMTPFPSIRSLREACGAKHSDDLFG
ncbi:MAG: hypothetical protein AUJ52_07510 [Elusimicrobia bacterium CG1_02_63_36]|nr:MAG: hypothetical protein AUJ52_07510 [Elusimicrobia bacterium CG1_02_63_36]